MTMLAKMRSFAQSHPALFSGVWFAAAALLLALPLAAMILLFLGLEMLAGHPVGVYAAVMIASIGLPLIPSFGTGALAGPQILRLPARKRGHAAVWGAVAALGALLLGLLLLEGIPRLFGERMQAAGSGGDVPGAAVVVGYVVVLPLIVILPLLVGAIAGVLLHYFAARTAAD
jgi:hypothetical protein